MTDELTQAVESGKFTAKTAEVLALLTPGAYCTHKSWGFGRVAEWNLIAGQVFIDFGPKKAHPMQAEYAAETLTPIPANHILARKATDAAAVKEQAMTDPLAFVRQVLSDLGGRATSDQIGAVLQPEIFDVAGFRKWWESTKKKLKTDGHFQIPTKKTDPFVLLDTAVNSGLGLIEVFRNARHSKDQLIALDLIIKSLADLSAEVQELQVLTSQIEETAQKGRKLQPAAAAEMLIARDEILSRYPAVKATEGALSVADILIGEETRLSALFVALPAAKHRRALEAFPAAFGDRWTDKSLRLSLNGSSRLAIEVYRLFEKNGRVDDFRAALARWISERSVSTEMLIWLSRERGAAFPELFNPDLLGCVFSALELDMLNEKRGSRLRDLLMDDRTLLGEFLTTADRDTVRDTMRKLLLTPVFDDLTKRSLMARIVKLYPDTQSMITGNTPEEKSEALTVSWSSLEKRKSEFEHLITKEIPDNTRDIAIAKEEGDLRENFGFKAAKENQRVLMRRRVEGERDLELARGTNFENTDTSQVSIGSTVVISSPDGTEETYSILGAWDSAPEYGIVSYKAAIGHGLLGHKVGETVDLSTEEGTRKVTIKSITAFTDIALLAEKVHIFRPVGG